jgi:hypothetical protein
MKRLRTIFLSTALLATLLLPIATLADDMKPGMGPGGPGGMGMGMMMGPGMMGYGMMGPHGPGMMGHGCSMGHDMVKALVETMKIVRDLNPAPTEADKKKLSQLIAGFEEAMKERMEVMKLEQEIWDKKKELMERKKMLMEDQDGM